MSTPIEALREATTLSYVLRYGGMCRDCADEDGVCPGSGLPCDSDAAKRAVRHVIEALDYGRKHGFLALSHATPAPGELTNAEAQKIGSAIMKTRSYGKTAEHHDVALSRPRDEKPSRRGNALRWYFGRRPMNIKDEASARRGLWALLIAAAKFWWRGVTSPMTEEDKDWMQTW